MNGDHIDNYRFYQKPTKQITFENVMLEESFAAQWANYSWTEYLALPGCDRWIDPDNPCDTKADVLARYRRHCQIENVKNDFPPPKKR